MNEIEFTERELIIMNEAFMTGRIYSNLGEKEKPSDINDKLVENCKKAIQMRSRPLSREIGAHAYKVEIITPLMEYNHMVSVEDDLEILRQSLKKVDREASKVIDINKQTPTNQ